MMPVDTPRPVRPILTVELTQFLERCPATDTLWSSCRKTNFQPSGPSALFVCQGKHDRP